jgi:hypothetical protein
MQTEEKHNLMTFPFPTMCLAPPLSEFVDVEIIHSAEAAPFTGCPATRKNIHPEGIRPE